MHWTRHDDGSLTAGLYSVQRSHKGGYHAVLADEDGDTLAQSEVYATKYEARAWAEGHESRGESDRRRLAESLSLDATAEAETYPAGLSDTRKGDGQRIG